MALKFNAENAISGNWGELWIDGEKLAEVESFMLKINMIKEDVPVCGSAKGKGKKSMGWDGTGSLSYTKVDSKLLKKQVELHKAGKPLVCTLTGKLADPAAIEGKHEMITATGVQFDDITLMNWANGQIGKIEKPFTFDNYELLDVIE